MIIFANIRLQKILMQWISKHQSTNWMIIKATKTYIVQSFGMVGNMVSEFFDH